MKYIIPILIIITCGLIQLSSSEDEEQDTYRCEKLILGTLDIQSNPYVKPGDRDNNTVWYQYVTWDRHPINQVLVNVAVTVNKWGKVTKKLNSRSPVGLFDTDLREQEASFADLMRLALGIPRFQNAPWGKVEVDPQLFSPTPCTVFYTSVRSWDNAFEYTFDITVSAKEDGRENVIMKGTLIKPAKRILHRNEWITKA